MKFCTHCGSQIYDEAVVCVHCGSSVNTNSLNQQSALQQQNVKRKVSVLGIISLIVTLVSVLFSFLFEVALLINVTTFVLSIISLVRVKRKQLAGKGFGIVAIILSSILAVTYAYVFIIAYFNV